MVRTPAATLIFLCLSAAPAGALAQPAPPPAPPPPDVELPPAPSPGAPVSAQAPAAPPPSMPGRMPHVRFYAGGAGVDQVGTTGGAGLLGFQTYGDLFPIIQWYWGAELIGARVGSGLLGLIDFDLGGRFTPFPDWPLRPYLRGNVGLSLLVVLPIPSAGVAVGMMLPVFNTIFLDVAVGGRRVYNVFDTTQSVDLGVFELSVGF